MAEIAVQPGIKFTIKSTGQYVLGDGSGDGTVASYLLHIVDAGSFAGTIIPKARSAACWATTGTITQAPSGGGTTLDDITFTAVAYFNEATGLYATASITAVPSIITMRASGLQVCLDCTVLSAGTATVYVQRVLGASA